jgi:predicted nucleic acid-binding protein
LMMDELNRSRRKIAVKIVADAYAWIEIFLGSERGSKAKEILEEADEVYTPDTVLAEIARKYLREGTDEKITAERLGIVTSASDLTHVDVRVALEAARCYMQMSKNAKKEKLKAPSLFDAIVLATAKAFKAKVLTGDEHFRNLPETSWL